MADPHAHTPSVRHHHVTRDSPAPVRHGMGHDAAAPDLDAGWDGLSTRLVPGPCGSAYDVLHEDAPVVVPAATPAEAGWPLVASPAEDPKPWVRQDQRRSRRRERTCSTTF